MAGLSLKVLFDHLLRTVARIMEAALATCAWPACYSGKHPEQRHYCTHHTPLERQRQQRVRLLSTSSFAKALPSPGNRYALQLE